MNIVRSSHMNWHMENALRKGQLALSITSQIAERERCVVSTRRIRA